MPRVTLICNDGSTEIFWPVLDNDRWNQRSILKNDMTTFYTNICNNKE